MTGQVFFKSYPELYDTFLNEFKKFSPTDMRPSLYPTLLILSRLYQSQSKPDDSISQVSLTMHFKIFVLFVIFKILIIKTLFNMKFINIPFNCY